MGRGSHLSPHPQEYEHLAASLDGARTPLLEKMRAFSPASSEVDLVEAAEAHAWQLDQLALNLSRYGARRGYPGGSQDLEETPMLRRAPRRRGRCPAGAGGAGAQVDRRSTAGSRGACTRVGPWGRRGPAQQPSPRHTLGSPHLLSQHHPRRQPGSLHPAGHRGRQRLQQHPASRAGCRGRRQAGAAAGEPHVGGEALPLPAASKGNPLPAGQVSTVPCPRVHRWWCSGAWRPKPGSSWPTAVPWKRPSLGSSGGWASVGAGPPGSPGLWGPSPLGHSV